MIKKKSLGRGLGAILEEVEQAYMNDLALNIDSVVELDLDSILSNPFQPRHSFDEESLKELSDSIKKYGLLQPILVYKDEDKYRLIAGERRVRASKMAGLDKIKALVIDIDIKNLREMALIENIQREDLNPIDLAICYNELLNEHGLTHEELANRVNKSRTVITNTVRLLKLSEYAINCIKNNQISHGHAKILVGLSENEQKIVIDTIIGQKLTVSQTEEMVKNLKKSEKNGDTKSVDKPFVVDFKPLNLFIDELKKGSLDVKLKKNSITIKFSTNSELDYFLSKINI